MNLLFIIHAGFEKAGYLKQWAKICGHRLSFVHPYRGEALPTCEDVDALIVMGGPQSALELDQYPYLLEEITFLQACLDREIPILGVCLGAQLLGQALGAPAERSPHKEIGFFPLTLTKEAQADPIFQSVPNTFLSGHWHNDMLGLTPDADVLATSEGCPRQIVRYTPKAYGFQCHLEFTPNRIKDLLAFCTEDLTEDHYVQSPDTMLNQDYAEMHRILHHFLDSFFQEPSP